MRYQARTTRRSPARWRFLPALVAAVLLLALALVLARLATSGVALGPAGEALVVAVEQDTSWDERSWPDYVRELGPAERFEAPAAGTYVLGALDHLGRATGVTATVTYEMSEQGRARERQDLSGVDPAGNITNAEVSIELPGGGTYHGFLWNRSHLLAKSLGGPDDIANLVWATRTENVGANDARGGMAYPESLARVWLAAHPKGTLVWRARPVYVGDELLCRSVIVDVLSSDGALDLSVQVFNAAKGFEIDYATGAWHATGASAPALDASALVWVTPTGSAWHADLTCTGLAHARRETLSQMRRDEAEQAGLHPCQICAAGLV